MKKFIILSFCCIAFFVIVGCGVSKRALEDAEKRVEALSSKGVPDSSLSRAKVFLYQASDAKMRGNRGLARISADSMRILIAQAESQYKDDMSRLKPWINSKKSFVADETANLTGLHKKHLDSLMGIIDSFITINWLLQAESNTKELINYLPKLKSDEERAAELRPRISGVWICSQVTKHSEDKSVHAVEKKIFTFSKDGKVNLVENKKGKSTPYFKEDWEFISHGKWDVKGDTVALFIEKFKAARQDFWDKKEKDGRTQWVKTSHPRYDSLITDGSQDRFITFHDLMGDFDKR